MIAVRWRKLRGDLRASWGRLLAVQIAIALALAAVGIVLGARAVLGREIRASYLGSRPADATLELAGPIDDALLASVRARADIEAADRREMIQARVRARESDPWQMLVLFVVDDFEAMQLATVRPERGAWPPPPGAILVERTSPAVIGAGGDVPAHGEDREHRHTHAITEPVGAATVIVQTPHGPPVHLPIAGTVHDGGQAPSWQDHRGVAYASTDTVARLGESPALRQLLVRFRPAPATVADADRRTAALADSLRAQGREVRELRVPKLRQHPHQGLMEASQLVLLGFTLVLLVLCAIVVATMLSALLAREVRPIGVMKAIGATREQLAAMYGAFVLGLGIVAVAIALPLAYLGAHAMIDGIGGMMNLALDDRAIPVWVFIAIAALGTTVPLACAAIPIGRATRISVHDALAGHTGAEHLRPSRLPLAIRNALRRPARLALTTTLLVAGGALVLTAANVQRGLAQISSMLDGSRRYDLEIRLHAPIDPAALEAVAGIRRVEAWSIADASIARGDRATDIVRTYPDGAHGGLAVLAPPPGGTALVRAAILDGRWLAPGDTDAVVLGRGAANGARTGDRVTITAGGVRSAWTVVGIVDEVGPRAAYVTAEAFARATHLGAHLLRIETAAHDAPRRAAILASLERELARRGASVLYAMPSQLMRSIIDDHVFLVVRAVILAASLLALVGFIGLGSAMAINVAERTRELAILKAIGADGRRIFRLVAGEALFVGLASSALAVALAFPLTALACARIGARGLLAPPPFAISYVALVAVPLAMGLGAVLASLAPARRAMRLSVRAALAE